MGNSLKISYHAMLPIIEGNLIPKPNDKFAVIVSKFNAFVTEKLLNACLQTLLTSGVNEKNVEILKVPGAFELPTAAKNLIDFKIYDAIICIGCVIRGKTPHFDYICNSVSLELARLGGTSGVPVIFGVVTADNLEQAQDRAGGKAGNRGSEAAYAAIQMVNLLRELKDKIPS